MGLLLQSKHTSLHVAPRPDLIGSADIAAAAVTAFLDHIITEAVWHTVCAVKRKFAHTVWG